MCQNSMLSCEKSAILEYEKSQITTLLFDFQFRWDTRTRTKNDRTRICCVTITPYPKIKYGRCRFASAKVVFFFDTTIISGAFFLKKQIYFIFYAFCCYLALTL